MVLFWFDFYAYIYMYVECESPRKALEPHCTLKQEQSHCALLVQCFFADGELLFNSDSEPEMQGDTSWRSQYPGD